MIKLGGVTSGIHRFGGTEYKLGKREIGHVHGNHLVDIPFPLKVRNELVENGEAEPHHILPESGWVSVYLKNETDIDNAINLLKLSYQIASEKISSKENHPEKYLWNNRSNNSKSKVFVDVGISLDEFIAGLNGGAKNPLGDEGINIHNWMFKQKAFLRHIKSDGGKEKIIEEFEIR